MKAPTLRRPTRTIPPMTRFWSGLPSVEVSADAVGEGVDELVFLAPVTPSVAAVGAASVFVGSPEGVAAGLIVKAMGAVALFPSPSVRVA